MPLCTTDLSALLRRLDTMRDGYMGAPPGVAVPGGVASTVTELRVEEGAEGPWEVVVTVSIGSSSVAEVAMERPKDWRLLVPCELAVGTCRDCARVCNCGMSCCMTSPRALP